MQDKSKKSIETSKKKLCRSDADEFTFIEINDTFSSLNS